MPPGWQFVADMTRNPRGLPKPFSDTDALLRLVPEQLPLIVYVYDLVDQRNIYTNRCFTEMLGYPREDAERAGSTLLRDILHADDRHAMQLARQRYATAADREIIETEYRMRSADGQWHWLRSRDIVLSRKPDGSPRLILGTAADITVHKEAASRERELRQAIDREQQCLRRLLDLNERERRLVAYDIHDGFMQEVVSAQLGIDAMLEGLARTDPDSVPPLLRVRAFVRKAIGEARRVVSELRPATTDDGSLVEAIQFLADDAEASGALDVKFGYPEDLPRLSPLLERSLVRIVQESLTNVKRHAQTRQAEVRLSQIGEQVRLEIEDHGVGFDPLSVPPGRYGLEGIRERARLFAGQTTVRSHPGGGTLISVVVPIERPEQESQRAPAPPKKRAKAPKRRRKKK